MKGNGLVRSRTKPTDHTSIKKSGARGQILDGADHDGAGERRVQEEIGPAVRRVPSDLPLLSPDQEQPDLAGGASAGQTGCGEFGAGGHAA